MAKHSELQNLDREQFAEMVAGRTDLSGSRFRGSSKPCTAPEQVPRATADPREAPPPTTRRVPAQTDGRSASAAPPGRIS